MHIIFFLNSCFRCNIFIYVMNTSFYSSFLTATIINAERCIAMFCPLKYKTIVTKQKLKMVCVVQFILAVIFTFIQFNIPILDSGFYCGNIRRISITGRLISLLLLLVNVIPYICMLWHFRKKHQSVARVGEESDDKTRGKITLISSFLLVCYSSVIIMTDIQALFPTSVVLRIILFICEFLPSPTAS